MVVVEVLPSAAAAEMLPDLVRAFADLASLAATIEVIKAA